MNYNKKSKIMILGSSGFIGKNIQKYLLNKKFSNIISPSSVECNLLKYRNLKKYFYELMDSPEIIIYSAGLARSKISSKKNMDENNKMLENLLKIIDKKKLKCFIFLSSIDVYDLNQNKIFNENHVLTSKLLYGKSKIYGENLLKRKISRRKLLIFRTPGVFGKSSSSVINLFIQNIYYKNYIIVENKGNNYRDFLYVKDFTKIIFLFFTNQYSGTYNISSGKSLKVIEIINLISKVVKEKYKTVYKIDKKRDFDVSISNLKFMKKFPKFKFSSLKNSLLEII